MLTFFFDLMSTSRASQKTVYVWLLFWPDLVMVVRMFWKILVVFNVTLFSLNPYIILLFISTVISSLRYPLYLASSYGNQIISAKYTLHPWRSNFLHLIIQFLAFLPLPSNCVSLLTNRPISPVSSNSSQLQRELNSPIPHVFKYRLYLAANNHPGTFIFLSLLLNSLESPHT